MQFSWLRNRLVKFLGTSQGTIRKRKPRLSRYRPRIEELEDRFLLTVLTWNGGATGNWNTAGAWKKPDNSAATFMVGDDAIFNTAGAMVTLGADISANSVTFSAGATIKGSNTLTVSGGLIDVANGVAAEIDSLLSGNIALNSTTKVPANSGALTLGGNSSNTNLGVAVATGTLVLSKNTLLGPLTAANAVTAITDVKQNATVQLGTAGNGGDQIADGTTSFQTFLSAFRMSGGTFDVNGKTETIPSLQGSGTVTNTSTTAVALSVGANNQGALFSGGINGAVALTKVGTGTLELSGINTYTGATTINGGELELGVNGTTGNIDNTTSVAVAQNGSLIFNIADASPPAVSPYTFAKTIGGKGGIIKAGTGRVQLTGANTFTGGTTIANGTLIIGFLADATSGTSSLGPSTGGDNNLLTITGGTLQYRSSSNTSTARNVALGNGTIDVTGMAGMTPTLTLTGIVRDATKVGSNLNISPLTGDQAETAVAINPTNPMNILVGSNSMIGIGAGLDDGVEYSLDGGLSWTLSQIPNPPNQTALGDAAFAIDATGTIHYHHLVRDMTRIDPRNRMPLASLADAVSSDGGQTWQPFLVTNGEQEAEDMDMPGNDKELVTIGPDKSNPGKQAVYVTFHTDNVIQVIKSPDGKDWSAGTVAVSDPLTTSTTSTVGVGPTGNVYEAWADWSEPGKSFLRFNKSTDGGRTFMQQQPLIFRTTINPFRDFPGPTTLSPLGGPLLAPTLVPFTIPAQPRRGINAAPTMAVDRTGGPHNGRIYLSFVNQEQFSGHDNTGIFVVASDDEGATWAALGADTTVPSTTPTPLPVKINDDTGAASQIFPWIAVDPTTGNVAVSWLDARDDPNNQLVREYFSISTDGGKTWSKNVAVQTGQTNAPILKGSADLLDYTGMDFYGGVVFPAWPDNSQALVPTGNGLDVVTAPVLAIVGQLMKTGAGTLALTGANTYSGGTKVSGGTLSISSDGNLGAVPTNPTLNLTLDGAVLSASDNVTLNVNRTLAVTAMAGDQFTAVAGKTLTIGGVIADAAGNTPAPNAPGTLTVAGPGTVAFNGLNIYKENTTINAGASLQLGDKTKNYNSSKSNVPGLITDNGALAFNRADLVVHLGRITGPGTVTQQGSGILVISNKTDDWSGLTTVDGGELLVESPIKPDGHITLAHNGQLVFKIFDNFNANPQTYLDFTYSGIIDGTGFVVKKGGNVLTLSGTNDYVGFTLVNNGILAISQDTNLGRVPASFATNLIMAGGMLRTTGTFTLARTRSILLTSKNVTLNVPNMSDTLTIDGLIDGRQKVFKSGAGTLVLTNAANRFTGGTVVAMGTLQVDKEGDFGLVPVKPSDNIVLAGGTLKVTDNISLNTNRNIKVTAVGSSITVDQGKTLTVNGTLAANFTDLGSLRVAGALTLATGSLFRTGFGAGTFNKLSSTKALTLDGAKLSLDLSGVTADQFNQAYPTNKMATLVETLSATDSITGTLNNADGGAALADGTEFSVQLGATTFRFKLSYAAKTIKITRTA